MNVFQYIKLDREAQELLNSRLPSGVKCLEPPEDASVEQIKELFFECEVAFGNIPADWLISSPVIKWLQLESVGYEPYLEVLPEFTEKGILTNLHGFFGPAVAETALAGILCLLRSIDQLVLLKEKSEWVGTPIRTGLSFLQRSNVLIAGGGNIGQTFKKLLAGFETHITVFDKSPEVADITSSEELDRQLETADIVFSCLPAGKETNCFFDRKRLERMKPEALFVNVGRGTVVEEKVLIKRLNEGKIAGAVLDVTEREPLPETHELWACPNLIITQHTGGGSRSELKGKVSVFLENLELYLAGQPLKRVVTL